MGERRVFTKEFKEQAVELVRRGDRKPGELAAEPKILILDEPTEGIQPSIIQDIGRAIRRINSEKGITVLLVEQYLEFVLEISDNLYIMEKGNVVLSGATKELDAEHIHKLLTI